MPDKSGNYNCKKEETIMSDKSGNYNCIQKIILLLAETNEKPEKWR